MDWYGGGYVLTQEYCDHSHMWLGFNRSHGVVDCLVWWLGADAGVLCTSDVNGKARF